MSLVLQSSGGGQITIQEPTTASNFTQDLPAVSGTILTSASQSIPKAALPTGSVLQVVSATYATETTHATSTYTDTGLSATITPTSSSSKILVIVNQADCGKFSSNTAVQLRLLRNSTSIYVFSELTAYTNDTSLNVVSSGGNYLDSPATTSATTYKTQFASQANTNGVRVQYNNGVSSITLLEIAA
jgi:hypothetical protein